MRRLLMFGLFLIPVAAGQPQAKTPEACALLPDADVRTVLGLTVRERQPGTEHAGGLLLSQCYLGTGTARSVSIAVAADSRTADKTVTPSAFWRDHFHGAAEPAGRTHAHEEKPGTREGRKPEGESAARPISGIGDEAFWSGTRVAGALYVLRGRTFIRISVGGISDEAERIEKSRQLAARALAKFPAVR